MFSVPGNGTHTHRHAHPRTDSNGVPCERRRVRDQSNIPGEEGPELSQAVRRTHNVQPFSSLVKAPTEGGSSANSKRDKPNLHSAHQSRLLSAEDGVSQRVRVPCAHFRLEVSVPQSCPALCNPMDCSPPSASVHGIL